MAAERSRNRHPQEVGVLQLDASFVVVPPALNLCSAMLARRTSNCKGRRTRWDSIVCGKNVICILKRLEYHEPA